MNLTDRISGRGAAGGRGDDEDAASDALGGEGESSRERRERGQNGGGVQGEWMRGI